LRRFLDRLYFASGAIGAVFVLLICVLMLAQSILRELGVRTGAVNDLVAWSCAAASSIGAVCAGYLAFWANKFTYDSWRFHEMAQGLLPIPIWIPQSSFALGSILLFTAVVDELVMVLRGAKPSYVVAVEERHAKGDFSADV
jgi:TRAP-type C4-dicarboxylate transport system permease small subunit